MAGSAALNVKLFAPLGLLFGIDAIPDGALLGQRTAKGRERNEEHEDGRQFVTFWYHEQLVLSTW
jgi:hypothetical protein